MPFTLVTSFGNHKFVLNLWFQNYVTVLFSSGWGILKTEK